MYKAFDRWLFPYLRHCLRPVSNSHKHIILSVCDHFEPFHQTGGSVVTALSRLDRWKDEFSVVQEGFLDSVGRNPRHTFFYPIEQYHNEVVQSLADLCHDGAGETEVHLHHHDDNHQNLINTLIDGKNRLHDHGLLSLDKKGDIVFGFIHGNWAITNSHPLNKNCGVEYEITALREAGCYADFTMPAAPHQCQSRIVNSVYLSKDVRPNCSYNIGRHVAVGVEQMDNELLFIQGPLSFNWKTRKFGVLPKIENSDLTLSNPPSIQRFSLWVNANIHVRGKPDWVFVKLHTHGCNPQNLEMHLGGTLQKFYRELTEFLNGNSHIDLHFVTAREMVNVVHAAIDSCKGDPQDFYDYKYRKL